ncbi:MAG: arylesterase [Pseudobdellovibrionaceae bacterium]
MRPFLFLLLFFFYSFSFANKKLVILGDSITEGYGVSKEAAYPALLEKKLQSSGKGWTVINAGVSGSTTASAVSRMKWLFKAKPDAVMIVLGANDGLRGFKIEVTKKNLSDAIEYANREHVRVILGGIYLPPNYGKAYTEKFKDMFESLAKTYKVTFIPFILDNVAGNPKLNLADGIHPNEQGHKIIAENVFKILKETL